MDMLRKLLKKLLYHLAHPLLRFYRRNVVKKSPSSRAIIIKEEEILLVKNIGVDHWSLPGGTLEEKETPFQGLKRELEEELGMSVEKPTYQLGTYISKHDNKENAVFIFVVHPDSFFYKKQWEIDKVQWFYLKDLPSNLSPATKKRIAEFKEEKKNIIGEW